MSAPRQRRAVSFVDTDERPRRKSSSGSGPSTPTSPVYGYLAEEAIAADLGRSVGGVWRRLTSVDDPDSDLERWMYIGMLVPLLLAAVAAFWFVWTAVRDDAHGWPACCARLDPTTAAYRVCVRGHHCMSHASEAMYSQKSVL